MNMHFNDAVSPSRLRLAQSRRSQEGIAARVHKQEMAKRPGPLSAMLAKMKMQAFFQPAEVDNRLGTLWLEICDPDGRCVGAIPVTYAEARSYRRERRRNAA